MKKVFAIALAIIMTLSVVLGCSGKKETPPAKSTAVTQQQQKENGKVSSSAEKDKQNKQEKKAYNQNANNGQVAPASNTEARVSVEKGKSYTDKEHVAAYIHLYKTLPPNYITKGQANKLGWTTGTPNGSASPTTDWFTTRRPITRSSNDCTEIGGLQYGNCIGRQAF